MDSRPKEQDRCAAEADRIHSVLQGKAVHLLDGLRRGATDGLDPFLRAEARIGGLRPDRLRTLHRCGQLSLQTPATALLHAPLDKLRPRHSSRGPLPARLQAPLRFLPAHRGAGNREERNQRVRRAAAPAAHPLYLNGVGEVVLRVTRVQTQPTCGPAGRTDPRASKRSPRRKYLREAIAFPKNVDYDDEVFWGDRALAWMTGLPGLPSPSYQRLSTSIRHSPSIPVTRARLATLVLSQHTTPTPIRPAQPMPC